MPPNWFLRPWIWTVLDNPQLTFYFATTDWIGDTDELRVYYKTSAGGTWTQIGEDYDTLYAEWTKVILDLPNPSSEYYIAFEGKSNFGRGIDVDDVMVAETPTCMQPMNLMATHITNDSVELNWDTVDTATNGYEYFIFENGTDPNTGTPTATGTVTQGTTSAVVSGLDTFTVYDAYVKADCGAEGMSLLTGPAIFKTAEPLLTCGDKFYDRGGPNGNYENSADVTTIVVPENDGDTVTVTFTSFDTDFGWDVLYVHNGPDATYPLIDSGNPETPHFPAGGYYGQVIPGPFTSSHSSGALTFVFRSDYGVNRAGWEADITCGSLGIDSQGFENFSFYPNPVENTLSFRAENEIQNIAIYNVLGQEVMVAQPNSTTPTLQTENLAAGAYLMKVTINGNESTYRLLKK